MISPGGIQPRMKELEYRGGGGAGENDEEDEEDDDDDEEEEVVAGVPRDADSRFQRGSFYLGSREPSSSEPGVSSRDESSCFCEILTAKHALLSTAPRCPEHVALTLPLETPKTLNPQPSTLSPKP